MTMDKAVRERILELCREQDYTINKLAKLSKIAPSPLQEFINGTRNNIRIPTVYKICEAFDISIYDFFNTNDFKNLEQEIR